MKENFLKMTAGLLLIKSKLSKCQLHVNFQHEMGLMRNFRKCHQNGFPIHKTKHKTNLENLSQRILFNSLQSKSLSKIRKQRQKNHKIQTDPHELFFPKEAQKPYSSIIVRIFIYYKAQK